MLNHSSIEHARRHIPPPAFLWQVRESLEDDAFSVGEPVSNIGEVVARVMSIHVRFFLV